MSDTKILAGTEEDRPIKLAVAESEAEKSASDEMHSGSDPPKEEVSGSTTEAVSSIDGSHRERTDESQENGNLGDYRLAAENNSALVTAPVGSAHFNKLKALESLLRAEKYYHWTLIWFYSVALLSLFLAHRNLSQAILWQWLPVLAAILMIPETNQLLLECDPLMAERYASKSSQSIPVRVDALLPQEAICNWLVVAFCLLAAIIPFEPRTIQHILAVGQGCIVLAFLRHIASAFARDRDTDMGLFMLMPPSRSWHLPLVLQSCIARWTSTIKANPKSVKLVSIMLAVQFGLTFVENFLLEVWRSGGIPLTLTCGFLLSMLFPLTSIIAMSTARRLNLSRRPARNTFARLIQKMKMSAREFLTQRYTFLSAYSAFIFFFLFISFAPNGIGACAAGWLKSCAVDANLIQPSANLGQAFEPIVSSLVFIGLFQSLRSFCVSISAGFQNFLSCIFINRDSLFDALAETLSARSSRVVLPQAHPHVESICATLAWITFCYVLLFALFAFSPPMLSTGIMGWLRACMHDARIFNLDLNSHANLRMFLASIIAGYATMPVAISSCAFLGLRKAQELTVTNQGILSNSSVLGLRSWSNLKSVSVKNLGKPNCEVVLSFGLLSKIKLKVGRCKREQLLELLSAADEYAVACKFTSEALALRSKLQDELKSSTFAETNKFAATIFSPLNSGDSLKDGNYRIVRKLAGKSMSAVYLARNSENMHVVIKQFVIPSSARNSDKLTNSFHREYDLLSSLEHERLAKVYEYFEDDQARFIVMEHIRGQDLRSIVARRGERSEEVVRRWALDIAKLMQVMHGHSPPILHRDLTPDNIMEDEFGAIKLIDFGAAHQFVEGVTGTLVGKQCYIAPEQLRGKAGFSSDIYSFGCTLFFLLTGKDPLALKQCDLSSENAFLSKDLATLISKCTEFDERKRFSSFAEIISFLEGKSSGTVMMSSTADFEKQSTVEPDKE